jgi:hypothetical protein
MDRARTMPRALIGDAGWVCHIRICVMVQSEQTCVMLLTALYVHIGPLTCVSLSAPNGAPKGQNTQVLGPEDTDDMLVHAYQVNISQILSVRVSSQSISLSDSDMAVP